MCVCARACDGKYISGTQNVKRKQEKTKFIKFKNGKSETENQCLYIYWQTAMQAQDKHGHQRERVDYVYMWVIPAKN